MSDLKILEQLLNGYHLEPKELDKAKKILDQLNDEIFIRKN
jgi:hypothetical protein